MIPPGYYQLKLVILMGLGSSFAKSWLLAMYGMSSFVPRPFPICTFCACAVKRGKGGKERVWRESAYPSTDILEGICNHTAAWLPRHLLLAARVVL